MARDIDDLVPRVKTYAPRAPDPLVERFVREGARKLCSTARFWRVNDSYPIAQNCDEIPCPLPDAEIIAIEYARIDGRRIDPVTVEWLDANVSGWPDLVMDEAAARYITQLVEGTDRLVPPQSGTLTARYILQPSKDALTLPDFLVDRHDETIASYAAGMVLTTPNETFQNPQLGSALLASFDSALAGWKWKGARGQQGAPLRVKGRYL